MRSLVVASVLAVVLSSPSAALAAQPPAPQQTPETLAATAAALRSSRTPRRGRSSRPTSRRSSGRAAQKPRAGAAPQGAARRGRRRAAVAPGGNPMARLLLLPDISAIGSFAGAFDTYDVERLSPREGPFGPKDKPTPLFQELELGLQSVIDPYARADIFISFTPGGGRGRGGVPDDPEPARRAPGARRASSSARSAARTSSTRTCGSSWTRRSPAAGSSPTEVLSGPGVDVAWLAPLPWFAELHLAGQGTAPAPNEEDATERLTGDRAAAPVLLARRRDDPRRRALGGAPRRGDRRVPRSRRGRRVPPLAPAAARGPTWRSRASSTRGSSAEAACPTS